MKFTVDAEEQYDSMHAEKYSRLCFDGDIKSSTRLYSDTELSTQENNNWSPQSESLLEQQEEPNDFVQYKWRWVNVACIFGPIMAQSCLMMVFSPITAILRDAYETSDNVVDSNAAVFFIFNLLVNIPSVFLLESDDGMSKWFKRASLLTILGQWGRYLAITIFPNQFWITVFPAAMIAFGQSFFLNGISKLACVWFGDTQRVIAIGILTFGLALGSCFGFCIASFFVFEEDRHDHEKIKEETTNFMWFISWATTLLCAPVIFLYRQQPESFPSRSAQLCANLSKKRKLSILDEFPMLWRNMNFRYTLAIFTIMNGSANSLATIITFIIEPFGFNSYDSSLLGAVAVLCGFVSSVIFPIVIQKYQWYLNSMRIMVVGALVAQVALLFSLTSENLNYTIVAFSIFGMFNIPTISVTYSFATEITYPVSETIFACYFQLGSSLFSISTTYLSLYLIRQINATFVIIMYLSIYATCVLLVFYLSEDLRRLKLSAKVGNQENPIGNPLANFN